MNSFDATVEQLGRWTAARTTRRSFLHRIGQLAVVVAAGPVIGTLLAKRAEARVCGQSGVTPKCATFGCEGAGAVWGWCWYASDGCCRNGGLKKICDCCILNYPNVHGYCPAGTNVACIVESCGEDPRVLTTEIVGLTWDGDEGFFGSAAEAAHRSARRVVIADTTDPWTALIAGPLAGVLGVPLMAVRPEGLTMLQLARLTRWSTNAAMLVGPVSATVVNRLTEAGIRTDIVSSSTDRTTVCVEVATRVNALNDINRSVSVATTGLSAQVAPLAANFASLAGFPLAVGPAATDAIGMPTLAVGPEVPTSSVVGSERTIGQTVNAISLELADLAAATPFVDGRRVTLVPEGTVDIAGLINLESTIVYHPINQLGTTADWLTYQGLRAGKWTNVFVLQGPGQLTTDQYWRLQGTVNGFRVDDLMGVSGQGLPVIRQPMAERPIGMARTDGALPWGSEPAPSYWTSVAQTFRD